MEGVVLVAAIPPLRAGKGRQHSGRDDSLGGGRKLQVGLESRGMGAQPGMAVPQGRPGEDFLRRLAPALQIECA
jgi:hypothetical protein